MSKKKARHDTARHDEAIIRVLKEVYRSGGDAVDGYALSKSHRGGLGEEETGVLDEDDGYHVEL